MDFDGAPDFSNPNYGKTFTMEDSGDFFGDLFGPKGLQDLAASAGFGTAGLAGLGMFAAGAGGLAGTAEGAGALGFGTEAAGEGAGLSSWFSGLGETGMAGGAEAGAEGISGLSALTAEGGIAGGGSAGGLAEIGGAGLTGGAEAAGGIGEAAAGGASFWDKLVSGASSSLAKNPLGIGTAALGLGMNVMKGSKDSPEMDALRGQAGALSGQAGQLNAQGQQLASYLQSGTLPPGLQASVKAAADAYKARIIQNHAHNGMSTDPRQNSALGQELAQADLNAITMTASLGQQLMSSGQEFLKMGMNAQGLSEKIYESLIRLDREQSANTGKAIANMAAALSGGGGMRMAA